MRLGSTGQPPKTGRCAAAHRRFPVDFHIFRRITFQGFMGSMLNSFGSGKTRNPKGFEFMTKRNLHGATLECVQGDIARQPDMETVVNAANAELRIGGGVAGAIHRAAGPELEKECRPLAPIRPGQAVITGAHNLPNRYVIHCLGPIYGIDEPADELLAACYRNALQLAEQNKIASIAFPAISTGVFGYPNPDKPEPNREKKRWKVAQKDGAKGTLHKSKTWKLAKHKACAESGNFPSKIL
jgi:O-acetyl-ADP-ribose deacetylase